MYRARWQVELVIRRMKQVLKLAQLRGKTPQSNEATLFALQQGEVNEAREVIRQTIAQFNGNEAMPESCAVSSWALHTLSIQTWRVSVQGYWTHSRLRECWPRLVRFICSRHKQREHQESTVRRMLCRQFGLDESLLFNCSGA